MFTTFVLNDLVHVFVAKQSCPLVFLAAKFAKLLNFWPNHEAGVLILTTTDSIHASV